MTPDAFLEAVREDNETALSRLGSSKSLYADTAGEMEPGPVLRAAATAHHHAAAAFESWAATATDGTVADAWAGAAKRERETARSLAAALAEPGAEPDEFDPDAAPAAALALEAQEGAPARAGAAVGWALGREKKLEQATGFFVGQADPQTAGTLREAGDVTATQRDDALDLLADVCDDDADWARATDAAAAVLDAAYEEYTDSLEAMGVNPKPVC